MSDAKEDEILKNVGAVQTDVTTVKNLLSGSNEHATKKLVEDKTTKILDAIKAGPETSKNIFESLFEALGFKDMFAAFKDGSDWFSKIMLAIGALTVLVLGKTADLGKLFNTAYEKLSERRLNRNIAPGDPRRDGHVLTIGENGLPQRMTRAQMDSMNAVSINPHNISEATLNGLKSALEGLPPKIRDFNSATGAMKSPSVINKIADAVGKLKDKLTPNPKETITEVAGAIGELHDKLGPFQHDKLPKPRSLKQIGDAARDLVRDGDRLKQMFEELATASQGAAGAIGASPSAT